MLVSDRQTVPFLPANPEYSATRNQVCNVNAVVAAVLIQLFVQRDKFILSCVRITCLTLEILKNIVYLLTVVCNIFCCLQGRQKLAKFNKREFATLIIDILNDAKRRYAGTLSPTGNLLKPARGNALFSIQFVIKRTRYFFTSHSLSHRC
jgi:Spa2 homology domain (SHD) of GIT